MPSFAPSSVMAAAAGHQSPRTSPFDDLVGAVEELHEAKIRLAVVVSRLAGSAAPDPSSQPSGLTPTGDGLVDIVERETRNVRSVTADMFNELSRLERRL